MCAYISVFLFTKPAAFHMRHKYMHACVCTHTCVCMQTRNIEAQIYICIHTYAHNSHAVAAVYHERNPLRGHNSTRTSAPPRNHTARSSRHRSIHGPAPASFSRANSHAFGGRARNAVLGYCAHGAASDYGVASGYQGGGRQVRGQQATCSALCAAD
jgi:hypothetical protein